MKSTANDRGQLQHKLFYYNMLGALIVCIIVATAAILPLLNSLYLQEYQNLEFSHALQRGRAEQYFNSLRSIAEQITSRSRIRQELEKYNAGDISLPQLQQFSAPKLLDALARSPEARGLMRSDRNGNAVVSVGMAFSNSLQSNRSWRDGKTTVDGPVTINGDAYFRVTAPIKNRQSSIVGKDEVLFTIAALKQIARQHQGNKRESALVLAYQQGNSFSWLPLDDDSSPLLPPAREIEALLHKAAAGEIGRAEKAQPVLNFAKAVITYGPASPTEPYPLLILTDSKTIYANVIETIAKVSVTIVALMFLTGAGLVFLLKPLRDSALGYQEKLEQEIDTLKEILPICSYCKKVRDDEGYWDRIESYFERLSDVQLSHGICDDCMDIYFPEVKKKKSHND